MQDTRPLLIICTGSSFSHVRASHGDFGDWIKAGLAASNIIEIEAQSAAIYPNPRAIRGAVLSGSHAMVSDRALWSEALAEWIRLAHAENCPLLGICYGHQLIADALGGEAGYRPQGIELGSHEIILTEAAAQDPIFAQLPRTFMAHLVHSQAALKLPDGAIVLGASHSEKHQCFRLGQTTWGVQFHPEFNEAIMQIYINEHAGGTQRARVAPTPFAAQVLREFAAITLAHPSAAA